MLGAEGCLMEKSDGFFFFLYDFVWKYLNNIKKD